MAADAVLAILVIAVLAMMIVPLPTWLLDILIASNLSVSIAILLVVVYAPDALSIASFPSLLLLTTLFRLGLNVSSTRLILLQADAGQVIHAFGSFVVSGNYVVGAVVFLILTIIQYVVIARGGERIAEVGARFVLDAMPGKQMAIEAELRAGTIDAKSARSERRKLARESQFFGAMDGAMKFVKGDVIASILIVAINLVGGLAIGMAQHGLTLDVSLHRYGLLTIGDGLVTQIPALVLSIGAGLLVTRTASEDGAQSLGSDLALQLLRTPRALGVAAAFVLILALVPGLPLLPFMILGMSLAAGAWYRARVLKQSQFQAGSTIDRADAFVPRVAPWSIEVSSAIATSLGVLDPDHALFARLDQMREEIFSDLGAPLPRADVRVRASLADSEIVLSLQEVPARIFKLEKNDLADQVTAIARNIEPLLRARAADFIGLGETQDLLDELEALEPATVRNVVPKPISVVTLAEVLRRLVDEQVSIRDLRAVLEALAASSKTDPADLVEAVRTKLRRPMTYSLTRGARELDAWLLEPSVEETIRRGVIRSDMGSILSLAPSAARDIKGAFSEAISSRAPGALRVVVAPADIRRYVRKLLEADFPEVRVVCAAELLPEIIIRPIARISPGD
ncbi:MAG: flagellar biosynthesis protein FlhA [Polyangiaceae bacterium]